MANWSDLPPGPERRAAMLAHPLRPNISPVDFTKGEWADLEAAAVAHRDDEREPVHPFHLPPGPARRDLMQERGLNLSPNDFTSEEWSEIQQRADDTLAAFADERREDNHGA